jgi:hypothetical protein
MVRRWLSKDDVRPLIAVDSPEPYPSTGIRAHLTGIANGYLVSVGDSTTYIASLSEINDVLPGLMAKERMQRNAKNERY